MPLRGYQRKPARCAPSASLLARSVAPKSGTKTRKPLSPSKPSRALYSYWMSTPATKPTSNKVQSCAYTSYNPKIELRRPDGSKVSVTPQGTAFRYSFASLLDIAGISLDEANVAFDNATVESAPLWRMTGSLLELQLTCTNLVSNRIRAVDTECVLTPVVPLFNFFSYVDSESIDVAPGGGNASKVQRHRRGIKVKVAFSGEIGHFSVFKFLTEFFAAAVALQIIDVMTETLACEYLGAVRVRVVAPLTRPILCAHARRFWPRPHIGHIPPPRY